MFRNDSNSIAERKGNREIRVSFHSWLQHRDMIYQVLSIKGWDTSFISNAFALYKIRKSVFLQRDWGMFHVSMNEDSFTYGFVWKLGCRVCKTCSKHVPNILLKSILNLKWFFLLIILLLWIFYLFSKNSFYHFKLK